jgi:hypothetical protein
LSNQRFLSVKRLEEVIGASGKLTGFAGDLKNKAILLQLKNAKEGQEDILKLAIQPENVNWINIDYHQSNSY